MMSLTRLVAPTERLLTLAEAKQHLRVEGAEDDQLIESLIEAAEGHLDGADGILGRALVTQTWRLRLDRWPDDEILVPLPPLRSVSKVEYVDTSGNVQVWDAAQYDVDTESEPARIRPAYGYTWPAARLVPGAVRVEFEAGYGGAADVPRPIRQAALVLVGHLYEHREATITGTIISEVPLAFRNLVAPYRVRLGT